MTAAVDILTHKYFYAIGLALTNSLWYGLMGYIMLRLFISMLGEEKSELKYYLSYAVYFLVFFLTLYTIFTFTPIQSSTSSAGYIRLEYSHPGVISEYLDRFNLGFVTDSLVGINMFVQTHIAAIILLWFSGSIFFAARYVHSIRAAGQMRTKITVVTDSRIKHLSESIISKIKLRVNVIIGESGLVDVPAVLGILKPIIVLPAGILNSMPRDQIEMILAHELAHIKRMDPLFRLIQSLIEVILFFNPFVWMISRIIDVEREKSCDDYALDVFNNPVALSKALSSIAENSLKTGFAVRLTGESGEVYKRIRRILKPDHFTAGNVTALFSTLMITILFSVALLSILPVGGKAALVKNSRMNYHYADSFKGIENADELLNLLENKFGPKQNIRDKAGENAEVAEVETKSLSANNNHNREFHNTTQKLNVLESKLNDLLGSKSEFRNILGKINKNINRINKPEIVPGSGKSEALENTLQWEDFDFDFDKDIDLHNLREIEDHIKDIESVLGQIDKI